MLSDVLLSQMVSILMMELQELKNAYNAAYKFAIWKPLEAMLQQVAHSRRCSYQSSIGLLRKSYLTQNQKIMMTFSNLRWNNGTQMLISTNKNKLNRWKEKTTS